MMVGTTMIEDSSAMDDTKMIAEDVIEEHNGVYDGKWHIVSPEGFYLPEGLEYLKNSWEGSWDNYCMGRMERIHKYDASIKISNVPLGDAFKEVLHVLRKLRAYDTDLEIENCTGITTELQQNNLNCIMYYVKNLSIHNCLLTFDELAIIMYGAYKGGNSYILSNNVFVNKTLCHWERVREWLNEIKAHKVSVKVIDLRGCNLSVSEKEILKREFDSLNLLI